MHGFLESAVLWICAILTIIAVQGSFGACVAIGAMSIRDNIRERRSLLSWSALGALFVDVVMIVLGILAFLWVTEMILRGAGVTIG